MQCADQRMFEPFLAACDAANLQASASFVVCRWALLKSQMQLESNSNSHWPPVFLLTQLAGGLCIALLDMHNHQAVSSTVKQSSMYGGTGPSNPCTRYSALCKSCNACMVSKYNLLHWLNCYSRLYSVRVAACTCVRPQAVCRL